MSRRPTPAGSAEPVERPVLRQPVRSLVVWCHDWPAQAMGARPDDPAVVVFANRVVAATPAARAAGVAIGHRRREAQGRCPDLEVHERDEAREARAFEPVVQAIEAFTPRLELTRPGVCTFATIGPSRYFGGDRSLADQVRAAVDAVLAPRGWAGAVSLGVADGPFAAGIAARATNRSSAPDGVTIVAPGASPAFLAPLPVAVLDEAVLDQAGPDRGGHERDAAGFTDVLSRLGLVTLADLGALPAPDVLARFGPAGLRAHRLAQGLDERPPEATDPPADLAVEVELDPPAERVDAVAFVAKALADELFAALGARGLSCTRVLITAATGNGETVERLWRHEGTLSPGAVTDRVRWQLEGWLHASRSRPTAGVGLLRLAPDEVVPALGRQLGFWGGETEADRRALRAIARLQGLLGPEAVLVPEWSGGRGPAEQLTLVPAAAVDLREGRPATRRDWVRAPWPGRIPPPAPAVVLPERMPAEVVAADGRTVRVDGRGLPSAAPAEVAVDGGDGIGVAAWAGPWPAEERWWDSEAHRRRARLQVVGEDGAARLFVLEGGRWWLEALYD